MWSAACTIPYGTTWTYEQLAAHLGMSKGARAVGNALGANPLCLLVPCHRVIRKDGSYAGYNGGIENKRALLEFEKKTEKRIRNGFEKVKKWRPWRDSNPRPCA